MVLPTGLDPTLEANIEAAIKLSDINRFRTTFQEIFTNPFFKDCVKSLGPLGYMISGLSCLYILPVIITPDQHSDSEQVEKKEDIANPALEDVAVVVDDHLWSEDEEMSTPLSPPVNFIWQTAEVERGMLPQYATFTIQPVQERAAVQLLTARFANSGLLAEFQRMRPIHMEHTTLARSSGITIQAMQILLFKDFFKDILTFSGFRTPLHPHPMFVQGMVVNLQRIIYDFCVAGSGMQAVYACRNRNYTDYMTGVCYLHLFKMLFGMAKKLLNPPILIDRARIHTMISFLSRSMFVKLSSDGVNDVVKFIFDLNTLADTMSSRVPTPERIVEKFTRIINRMDSTSLNSYHHTFPMLFTGDEGEYTFIWLQELLLQKIVIPTRYDWDKTSKDLQQRISRKQSKHHHIPSRLPTVDNPGRGRSRTPSSRKTLDGPTSQTPHQLGHG